MSMPRPGKITSFGSGTKTCTIRSSGIHIGQLYPSTLVFPVPLAHTRLASEQIASPLKLKRTHSLSPAGRSRCNDSGKKPQDSSDPFTATCASLATTSGWEQQFLEDKSIQSSHGGGREFLKAWALQS